MEPSFKDPELDFFLHSAFGFDRTEAIRNNKCQPYPIGCGKELNPVEFTDDTSAIEYRISGLCQVCQDNIFGGEVPGDD